MRAGQQPERDSQGPRLFLRIKHPTLDPREITETLQLEPEQTISAGAEIAGGVRRLHSQSYWIAELAITPSGELVKRFQAAVRDLQSLDKNELLAVAGGTEWDARIYTRLKPLEHPEQRAFLQKILREGGSIALLVDRGEERSPFTIRRTLAKLAEFGIELEVD